MKKLVLLVPLLALAGCATETAVHPLGHNQYLLCDVASDTDGGCSGSNPEKGIGAVCFPRHQAIVSVRKAGVEDGVIVTCGEAR